MNGPFVAIDVETTGTEIEKGAAIIQFGMAYEDQTFGLDIMPLAATLDPEALAVNGFTEERILAGTREPEADKRIAAQLEAWGLPKGSVVAVGYNVGGFDLPFIHEYLPLTAEFLHRGGRTGARTMDLTGVTFLLAEAAGLSYDEMKAALHKNAAEVLGYSKRHDAFYDAQAALYIFNRLRGAILEGANNRNS